VRVGARSAIEDNAVVHATSGRTTVIGNDVTVGHGAVLDDCTVENGALVGSNAVVLNGAIVGQNSVIAAGSVVRVDDHVPAGVVSAGAPARVRTTVTVRHAGWIEHATAESLEEARSYRRDNIGDPAHHDVKSASRRKPGAVVV